MDLLRLTLSQAREAISHSKFTPEDLHQACYERIGRLNPRLNAFITVLPPGQAQLPARPGSPLRGLPLAVKDLYETAGTRTTAGSRFFAEYVPQEDAAAVRRLRNAGAAILGKTNTHEIALGVTNLNPHFGNCLNPWDTQRITGGSSGGSAAAVAAGMVPAALGTDTGGSIRIPASLCGVTGLKPTRGRISLRGVLPLSWNLDHAGPLTRCTRDAALLLQVLAGYDALDPFSLNARVDDYLETIDQGVKDWRIALAVGDYIEDADAGVLAALQEAARVFRGLGAEVVETEVEWLRESALANGLMTQADAAAFHRERLAQRPDWFGADVRLRLEQGAAYSSGEYALARRTQTLSRRKAEALFEDFDALLLPTTPIPAPRIEGADALEQARRLTRFTAPFNLTGLPAISVPCGFSSEGLPLGLQIVGRAWGEVLLLRAAQAFENATNWPGERQPPGTV